MLYAGKWITPKFKIQQVPGHGACLRKLAKKFKFDGFVLEFSSMWRATMVSDAASHFDAREVRVSHV